MDDLLLKQLHELAEILKLATPEQKEALAKLMQEIKLQAEIRLMLDEVDSTPVIQAMKKPTDGSDRQA